MPGSTYSTNLKVELMATGENSGTWGDITNTNLGTALEQAIVGYGNPDYASDANLTISITNSNAAQAARALVLNVTSSLSLTATRELVVPTIQKQYIVQNNTTGSQSITVKTSAGTGITVPNGRKAHLYVNGTDVIQMFDFVDINGGTIDNTPIGVSNSAAGAFTTLNASGATTLDGNVTLGNASGDNVTVTGTITSHLLFTDNTYDIGANGATRPRNLFLAGAATIGGNLSVGGTLTLTGGVNLNGNVTVGDNSSDTLTINSTITSNLIFTDNTYDIGASGATRPRNLFLAGNATIGGNVTTAGRVIVDDTTDTSSATTGSIQTDGGVGIAKGLYVGGNTTLGNATSDTLAIGALVNSNLLFTDNTYDIGASGANRPRNAYFSKIVYAGQTASDFQFLALDYGGASAGGIADGIYTSSIKAGTYQAIGFDTRYLNAGSWGSSTTTATIVDGYLGQFRVFTNSGLTAGNAYAPSLRFSIGSTGLAEFRTGATDLTIYNNITVANEAGSTAYGGIIGQRFIGSDQRQGMFVKGTGSLTLLAQYNIDFLAGQTAVPVAADTGLALRIASTGRIAMGSTTPSDQGILTVGTTSISDKNGIVFNRGAAASVSATQSAIFNLGNGIGTSEGLFFRAPGGFAWQSNDGVSEWMRLIGSSGNLLIGTQSSIAKLTVNGDAIFGQISPLTRFTSIGNTGIPTIRYDDNGIGQIILQNLGITGSDQGFRMSAQFSGDGTSTYLGGYIQFLTEGAYTGTASTRDSALTFATVTDGTQVEKVRITGAGRVGVNTQTPGSILEVVGASAIDSSGATGAWTLRLRDTAATGLANTGSSILLQGIKSTAGSVGNYAAIAGLKENSTNGNEDGRLVFYTVPNSTGLITERGQFTSTGRFVVNWTSEWLGANSRPLQTKDGITLGNTASNYLFTTVTAGSNGYDLELIANAYPANLGVDANIIFKSGNSGGGGPGTLGRFVSDGTFVVSASGPETNYGRVQINQPSGGTASSLGFTGSDNATISTKFSMVFQIDSATGQSGRQYSWKHNGKGYTDGDLLMTLDADASQLRVATSQPVVDNYSGTTRPGVVSSKAVSTTSIDDNGSASIISKVFNVNPGNTYTVRVYPSDTGYALTDIRLGVYCSAGSGSANSFFSYGGHTGAYNLNTVFNSFSGNTSVGAVSVNGGGWIQFTITITGGNSGVAVVRVDDAGGTAGKTAFIVVV